MSCFNGIAILCFYPNGLFQGHCIHPINNDSPYSIAGRLIDHTDPKHNDCMEPDDFYDVLIHSHEKGKDAISLILRRPKNNDAGGLFSHDNEHESNNGFRFLFETNQFLSGQQAMSLKKKYFVNSKQDKTYEVGQDLIVCIGTIQFSKEPEK